MKLRRVVALCCLILISGSCTVTRVGDDLPCPNRPNLMAIPVDLQIQMPAEAVWITAENLLAMQAYAKKLEARLGCQQ